jgi:hypothetical protein
MRVSLSFLFFSAVDRYHDVCVHHAASKISHTHEHVQNMGYADGDVGSSPSSCAENGSTSPTWRVDLHSLCLFDPNPDEMQSFGPSDFCSTIGRMSNDILGAMFNITVGTYH